jgi:AraC-like DNA-binding protein
VVPDDAHGAGGRRQRSTRNDTEPGVSDAKQLRRRTDDLDEAQSVVTEVYLPNRPEALGAGRLNFSLDAIPLGSSTVGRLAYGVDLRLRTENASQYHVNVTLRGRAVSRTGNAPERATVPGQAAVFQPDQPAELVWLNHCEQLCLMIPRGVLEDEVEQLVGKSVRAPLEFETLMDLTAPTCVGWRETLHVLVGELDAPSALLSVPRVGHHLERVIVDGLLLSQPHNYSDAILSRRGRPAAPSAIAQAIQLLEERPEEPWSTTSLARHVHLGVRALQEGFPRHTGLPPMKYLREVRLRSARELLESSSRETASITRRASGLGFAHLGRFSAVYKEKYGECPSQTLSRPPL